MEGVKIFACRRPVKRRDTASGNFLNFCVPQREREIAQAAADTLPAAPTSTAMPAKCCHAPNAKASTGRSVTNPSYFVDQPTELRRRSCQRRAAQVGRA